MVVGPGHMVGPGCVFGLGNGFGLGRGIGPSRAIILTLLACLRHSGDIYFLILTLNITDTQQATAAI